MISTTHIFGIILTVSLLLFVSWWSGRQVKDARSFMTGGTSGSWMVCGALLGTLAGGQSTVGTAQLAFCYGLSAWWFTIGAGLGALLLGLVYAAPLRRSGCTTLLEIVGREYGRKAETLGSVLFLAGIFISIMAQVLSSSAMIGSLFGIPMVWASVIGALLIMLFVLFGGIRSAGASGIIKLILLYFSSLAAGVVVWHIGGGFSGLRESIDGICQLPAVSELNALPDIESIHHRYGSMLARGVMKDLGDCLSLILGVVSTQTYAQCIWSGADTPRAKRGALLCAFFIPIIGAACTLVGIYMRGHYITAEEWDAMQRAGETIPAGVGIIAHSAQAFPQFILNHLPDWLGGIMLGTLLINIIGCGSGLSLGAATILVRDVYTNISARFKWKDGRLTTLQQTRLSIVGLLMVAVLATLIFNGSFINDLGFLSLGLRAMAILFPLSFALWMPGRFDAKRVLLSMPTGVVVMLLANVLSLPGDAVYYGLTASLSILLIKKRCID